MIYFIFLWWYIDERGATLFGFPCVFLTLLNVDLWCKLPDPWIGDNWYCSVGSMSNRRRSWKPCYLGIIHGSGAHFTNNFSITIQMWWKFHLTLIQLLMITSQQNLAHATTAQLSWHVPNIVAITLLVFGWEQNKISITFELWWKNC